MKKKIFLAAMLMSSQMNAISLKQSFIKADKHRSEAVTVIQIASAIVIGAYIQAKIQKLVDIAVDHLLNNSN